MNAPEKCPVCQSPTEGFVVQSSILGEQEEGGETIRCYECFTQHNGSAFFLSPICLERANARLMERDALRAEVAALKVERAGMVTREVAERACELREMTKCEDCYGRGYTREDGYGHQFPCFCTSPEAEKDELGRGWVQITTEEALARAEAEAAKATPIPDGYYVTSDPNKMSADALQAGADSELVRRAEAGKDGR